jgi:flagellar motility protein MotE (MotC chaperone)
MFAIGKKMTGLPVFGFLVFCGSLGIMFALKTFFIKELPPRMVVPSETSVIEDETGKSDNVLGGSVPRISAVSILRPYSNSDVAKFLAEIETLKDEYEKKKELLTWKEKMLQSVEASLDAEKKALVALRSELVETIRLADEKRAELKKEVITFKQSEVKNLKKLALVYGGMKPDKAAAIIREMDDDTAVKLLSLMDGRSSAKILQAVEPDRAVRLSEKIRVVSR